MKRILVFCVGIVILSSCHNYRQDAERLTLVKDSLQSEAAFKDSSIVEFLNDFNEIQSNLDSIKKIEDLVTVESTGREMRMSQKTKILEDIALLNGLLQKNKELAASLQSRLNNADYRAGQLQSVVAELEQMVDNLQGQIEEKDSEIVALTERVRQLNVDIGSLNEKIAEIETENQQKTETIEQQTLELNKAYFAYGSAKELVNNSVIEKSGGFLGIGRTSEIKENFNRDYFTEIDIRDFDNIPLMTKKAELVSVHPAGSFHISGEKSTDTLFIDNKAEFWKASKYLVIVTN